jgi:catechol 2,3-dioxygenase-like lactoylglutathione lyase family enzyme
MGRRVAPSILINIDVDDLDKATAFYTALLGLKVGRKFGGGAVELIGGAVPLYLLAKKAGTSASKATGEKRRYGRHWTPVHLDFVVPDVAKSVVAALAAGARLDAPVTAHTWGKIACLADPFGNGFCLLQFVGRGYDEIATR